MTSNIVKFIYKNKIVEIKNPDTNETILNYVRTKLKKTGTKEGCAEGGCGACTVVIGELEKNNIKYKAINSCISFLPSLEGKQLILVEDLVFNDVIEDPNAMYIAKSNPPNPQKPTILDYWYFSSSKNMDIINRFH